MKAKKEIVWKVIYLLEWTSDYFKKHNIESYRLKSELLLADVLNCSRLELYRDYNKPLTKSELAKFKEYIKRVLKHEPVQMIIGKVPFLNAEIYVDSSSIVPRPETEQLVSIMINENIERKKLKILDIGTGSGCIAINAALAFPDADVVAVEKDGKALNLAKRNVRHNDIKNINLYQMDILHELPKGQFDIIISNPPYIPIEEYKELALEVKNWEPAEALTDRGDGLTFYQRFASVFPDLLTSNGRFYLEIGWNQAGKMEEVFSNDKFFLRIDNDFENIPRFLVGQLK